MGRLVPLTPPNFLASCSFKQLPCETKAENGQSRDRWTNEIQSLFERENGGPYWSREDGDIHAPAGFSAIDVLNVLGELGATIKNYPVLHDSVEFILLFYYVYVRSHYRMAHRDDRFREASAALSGKLTTGQMPVEAPYRAWQFYTFARRCHISELVTMRWLEIEKKVKV